MKTTKEYTSHSFSTCTDKNYQRIWHILIILSFESIHQNGEIHEKYQRIIATESVTGDDESISLENEMLIEAKTGLYG